MSKLLVIKNKSEYSYKRKEEDTRIWLLSDKQIEQVTDFVIEQFFRQEDKMEYKEVMKHVDKIYDALAVGFVSKETENAFTEILDGYEQWCHL